MMPAARRRTAGAFAVTVLLLALLLLVPGQNAGAQQEGGENEVPEIDTGDYEPYSEDEFPRWARDLRRFESIFFGSIPFTFFFTSAGFETYAYVSHGYSSEYLPLFLGNSPAKQQYLADTLWQRVAVGLSLSALVATIDYLLGLGDDERRDSSHGR